MAPTHTHLEADREDADVGARVRRLDRPGPRYTSYPTALEFRDDFGEDEARAALSRAAERPEAPLALYAHLPFCEARCLYCACTVVVTPHRDVAAAYLDRVVRELALVSEALGERRTVTQFHLGGGTPTYYTPAQLGALMDRVRERFTFTPDAELALECDPRVTSEEQLETLAARGFNRLSIGVQDFEPEVQRSIGRVQSVALTERLMTRARALGFGSINLDLIYGLPHQTPASLDRTLEAVEALRPDRLAVYSFAYLPSRYAHQRALPQAAMPSGEEKFSLLQRVRQRLVAAGYLDIGMDHFALPGDELVAAQREGRLWRNFMGYTASRAPDLVGVGMSAIGEVGGAYVQNEKRLARYQERVDAGRLPVARGRQLDADDRLRRHLIREWMCHFEVDKGALESAHGIRFDEYFAAELRELAPLAREGLVRLTPDRIVAGDLGRLLPRNVAMVFDRYLPARASGGAAPFSRTV